MYIQTASAFRLYSVSLQRDLIPFDPLKSFVMAAPRHPANASQSAKKFIRPLTVFCYPVFLWIDRRITSYCFSSRQSESVTRHIAQMLTRLFFVVILAVRVWDRVQFGVQLVRCITIHGLRNHQCDSESFLWGKTYYFVA